MGEEKIHSLYLQPKDTSSQFRPPTVWYRYAYAYLYIATCHSYIATCHLYIATCHSYIATCHLYIATCHSYIATCHSGVPVLFRTLRSTSTIPYRPLTRDRY